MQIIPLYPEFRPLEMNMRGELRDVFNSLTDGISEFTFANLYLHRKKYSYRISLTKDGIVLVTGESATSAFFSTVNGLPEKQILLDLFAQGRFWKFISASQVLQNGTRLAEWGIQITEDRDNSDYLYLRSDLAELKGKTFHKKKNLVNSFANSYVHEVKPLTVALKDDALRVLERWNEGRTGVTDYEPAKEALSLLEELELTGWIVYADREPVAWSLGEKMGADTFCVHFEKGLERIKGVYQFVNNRTAQQLAENITYVNREQDLGDEGLRQAKMTYRPCGFVVKYAGKTPALLG